jgi:serine protease Do
VTSVRTGGASHEAKPALDREDIILEVGSKPVHTIKELTAVSTEILRDKTTPTPVLVGFERHGQRFLTVIRLGERESPDRSAEANKAWLPVGLQALTAELAEALGLKGKKGVRLTQVHAGSTAEKAGLKIGDILLKFDGDPIDVAQPEDVESFTTMVRRYRIGDKVKVDVVRDGKPLAVEVELAPSPKATRQLVEYHNTQFDFRARDIVFQDRVQQELPLDQKGALIMDVDRGGWASLAHLSPNDIVLAVDGHPIQNVEDLKEQMKKIAETKPKRVVFFVRHRIHTRFLELEPDWSAK